MNKKIVFCNKCGKEVKAQNGLLLEDVLEISKAWGYFSNKDGETHRLCLCEDCYDKFVSEFVIPVDKNTTTELV